jgi:hypothetical protein
MSQLSGRPPREDRTTVAETTLTIRLTRSEKAGLEQIVEMRQSEVRRTYGPGACLTMAGYIRSMIAREIELVLGNKYPDLDAPTVDERPYRTACAPSAEDRPRRIPTSPAAGPFNPLDLHPSLAPLHPARTDSHRQANRGDAAGLRKRIEHALEGGAKRFESAAELARQSGLSQNDISRFRKGKGLKAAKFAALEWALKKRGC